MKATKRKPLSDRQRGQIDGFNSNDRRDEPAGASADYREGYAAGQSEREQAHQRMQATCERFRRLAAV